METRKEQWAWMKPGSCEAHGEFDTREEAIQDAAKHLTPGELVIVGPVDWPDPEVWMPNSDSIIDQACEDACSNGYHDNGDPIFEEKPGAEEALDKLLRAWARQYLEPAYWTLHSEHGNRR